MESEDESFSDQGSASDMESGDSDKELQIAFQKGLLKPGLNIEVQEKQKYINDVAGLKQTLEEFHNGLPWIERMDVTVAPLAPPQPLAAQLGEDPNDLSGDAVHDDYKREMVFYRQAQAAILEGLPKLKKMGIPTRRPDDYYAEMAKSDPHMKKVREKLIAKQLSTERSEKAKKMRELRKYGKKIQTEVIQKRQKEKKEMLDAVKKYKKGKKPDLSFLDENNTGTTTKKGDPQGKKDIFQPNKKRKVKNDKFGFGGQKKRSKYNTSESARDMSSYSVRKHGTAQGKKAAQGGNKNRPGKKRRQGQKSKRNS